MYDLFSLFLGVQSAPEVDAASYETPIIIRSRSRKLESKRKMGKPKTYTNVTANSFIR